MVLHHSKRPLIFPPRPLGDMFCKSEGLIQSGTHILSYCDDSFAIKLCPPIGRPGTGTCRPSLSAPGWLKEHSPREVGSDLAELQERASLYYALWKPRRITSLN